jgi:hypothetical protein
VHVDGVRPLAKAGNGSPNWRGFVTHMVTDPTGNHGTQGYSQDVKNKAVEVLIKDSLLLNIFLRNLSELDK